MTPEQHEALTRIDADRKRWMACELQVDCQISNAEASELVEEFFRDGAKPVGWAQFYIDGTILDFSDDPDEVAGWKDEGLPVKPLFEHSEAVADPVSAETPPPSSQVDSHKLHEWSAGGVCHDCGCTFAGLSRVDPCPGQSPTPQNNSMGGNAEPDGWICEDEFTLEAEQRDEWVEEGLEPKPFYFAPPAPQTHVRVADLTSEQKEITLLRIIDAMGGRTDSSDYPGNWLTWFCSDEIHNVQEDTFNRCNDKGWLHTTHDTSFDTSTTTLTKAGRAALAAEGSQP